MCKAARTRPPGLVRLPRCRYVQVSESQMCRRVHRFTARCCASWHTLGTPGVARPRASSIVTGDPRMPNTSVGSRSCAFRVSSPTGSTCRYLWARTCDLWVMSQPVAVSRRRPRLKPAGHDELRVQAITPRSTPSRQLRRVSFPNRFPKPRAELGWALSSLFGPDRRRIYSPRGPVWNQSAMRPLSLSTP